ncbi:hypothetical protein D3880_07755 [Pseudomonas cavernae]|uniref:Uncharacterized protein n=1 Tax=Pseudomonas cavernae TaxID=2320867 RepID=A0A385Z0U4_9PSED|nr:hypothetical protein D3880_07755 [Pseudomonas cavernae]
MHTFLICISSRWQAEIQAYVGLDEDRHLHREGMDGVEIRVSDVFLGAFSAQGNATSRGRAVIWLGD